MNAWLQDGMLEESFDFLKGVLDASSEALVCTNAAGAILWANRRAEHMLGIRNGNLENDMLDQYIGTDDRSLYLRVMQEVLDDPSAARAVRIKGLDREGNGFYAEFRLKSFMYESAPVLVHTLRKVDEEVRDLQAPRVHETAVQYGDHAFEAFLGTLRDHLPGPVAEIVTLSYRALRKFEQGLVREGDVHRKGLGEAARNLAVLVEELGLNKSLVPASGVQETVSLDYVTSRALSEFSEILEQPGNRVSRGFLPEVKGDPEQLYKLFKHLIGNAVRFRKPQEPLMLAIDSFQGGNGVWHVLIKDNGMGFDNRDADRIFEPFVQLQKEGPRLGAGLGLTLCRRIVQSLGGKISALSEKGEGATFIITFPGPDHGAHRGIDADLF